VAHPFFVVFFILKSCKLSRLICCGRRMRTYQDEEKASKSGFPIMFNRNYQNAPLKEVWP